MINLILIICKAFFGIVSVVLLAFIGLSFSRGLRSKYQFLKWADGNRKFRLFLFFIVCIFLCYAAEAVQSYLTDRQRESIKEPVLTPAILGTKVRLTNEGPVEIKKICKKAVIGGYFDINTRKISDYQVVISQSLLKESLLPGKSIVLDIFPYLIPIPTVIQKDPISTMTVYGIVFTYRRAADMKTFVKFVPFAGVGLRDTNTSSMDVFMPLFPQSGVAEAGQANFKLIEEARSELIRLYNDKVAEIKIE